MKWGNACCSAWFHHLPYLIPFKWKWTETDYNRRRCRCRCRRPRLGPDIHTHPIIGGVPELRVQATSHAASQPATEMITQPTATNPNSRQSTIFQQQPAESRQRAGSNNSNRHSTVKCFACPAKAACEIFLTHTSTETHKHRQTHTPSMKKKKYRNPKKNNDKSGRQNCKALKSVSVAVASSSAALSLNECECSNSNTNNSHAHSHTHTHTGIQRATGDSTNPKPEQMISLVKRNERRRCSTMWERTFESASKAFSRSRSSSSTRQWDQIKHYLLEFLQIEIVIA